MEHTLHTQAAPTLFITDAEVEALADWDAAIAALREAYSRPSVEGATPDRAVSVTATGWQRTMPSAPTGAKYAGSKTITASLQSGLVSYLITLFDQHDSTLVALLDGNRVTGIRTAATAAAALPAIVRASRPVVAVVGSGFEARAQLQAASRVLDIAEVRVTSPTRANRERFAEDLANELGLTIIAVADPESAVRGADLVLCAARSYDESPTVLADWVDPGATVVSVGSTTPSQRELDTALIGRASFIVADALAEVLHDSGDMIAARRDGIDPEPVTVSLHHLLSGAATPPESGITIYKSTGSGFQDLVIAEMLHDRAVELGLGTPLPVGLITVQK